MNIVSSLIAELIKNTVMFKYFVCTINAGNVGLSQLLLLLIIMATEIQQLYEFKHVLLMKVIENRYENISKIMKYLF